MASKTVDPQHCPNHYQAGSNYNPSGPDGRGWNRVALTMRAGDSHRCRLHPLTAAAAWESTNRPLTWYDSYVHFGRCPFAGDASECPQAHTTGEKLNRPTVVREDEQGNLWLMNRPDRGWAELGIRYESWASLLAAWQLRVGARRADDHGAYYEVTPL